MRVTVVNVGSSPVRWSDFQPGWEVSTTAGPDPFLSTIGKNHVVWVHNDAVPRRAHALALAAGQATSTVIHGGPMWGIRDFYVVGGFDGVGGPSARAPGITIRLTK